MKKFVSLLLAMLMLLSVLTACASKPASTDSQTAQDTQTTETTEPAEETEADSTTEEEQPAETASSTSEGKRVVFLVNGNLGDKGFYDSCAEGIERLGSDYGCEIKIIEMGRDETAYETYFRDVSEQNWDLIVACTWSVQEVFEEVAADYPDQQYLFIDGEITSPNMMGITFRSYETAFMAGCLAALEIDNAAGNIDPEQKIAGFVGSMDIAAINDFLVGYIEGIQYIDDSIKVITSYVGSFEDVATCLEMTTQVYNQGAQVVYAPASQSIVGAVTASKNCNKMLIGCDTDLYTMLVDTDPELVANVVSSSLKKMGDAIVLAATGLWDGSKSTGETYSMGLAEGAVGLADNDNFQTLTTEETRAQLEDIVSKVVSGEITVNTAYTMETAEVEAMRESVKP